VRLMSKRRKIKSDSTVTTEVPAPPAESRRPGPRRWLLLAALFAGASACVVWVVAREHAPPTYGYEVVNEFPHHPQAYCQGLSISGDVLYESTGKYGESTLRRVDLETGKVQQVQKLDRSLFGEGLTIWDNQIIQLTWKNNIGIVYDRQTFQELRRFSYEGEGWGLTHDGQHLIMSDGSATLRFLDPRTFQVVRRLLVHSQGRRVDQLNELEYVNDEIFANLWYKDHIARISPQTGEVTGWIDLHGLLRGRPDPDAVLNGIAYDRASGRLFVTGKNWPKLFEIRLTAAP
jgi:glutamine cyclotransferase